MALARAGSLVTCLIMLAGLSLFTRREEAAAPGQSVALPGRGAVSGRVARSGRVALSGSRERRRALRSLLFWAMGVALLDTGGNLLFLASTRLGRLDVAAVLASLYPASTILLAAWQLHERPTRRQSLGMGLALLAVVAITI
jgi:drug/metabolite transporter (DMT)-like permease